MTHNDLPIYAPVHSCIMCMHVRALHTSHTAHCSTACWRTRVCMHPAARSPCVRHIRATPHTREIPNPNPSIRAGRARAGRLQNPSRAGRPCRTSEPSRAGRRPLRSEPSRAEHRQPKIRAVARLGSVRSLPGIEEKVEGNGLPRLQIYEYGHLGTGNGTAGLELV